jgi:hypothetical protein
MPRYGSLRRQKGTDLPVLDLSGSRYGAWGTTILPVLNKLSSDVSPEWMGENQLMLEMIDTVPHLTGKRGIWVLDRGSDRGEILRPFLKEEVHSLIRLLGDRHLIHRGGGGAVLDLASSCPVLYLERVIREQGTKEKLYFLKFGSPAAARISVGGR